MDEDKKRLYEERLAREEQRSAPFLHRLKEQSERHRVAEDEQLRNLYKKDKERRPIEAKFRQEYTTLLEAVRTDTHSCDAMQGSATETDLGSPTTATESVMAKTSLDLKDEYYERFVYPDDDNREWQDLVSSDSSSLDLFPYRGVRFPFTEISRQKMIYQSNTQRLWSKAQEDRKNQIKIQTLASLEARHQQAKMEFLCHRESRQQRQQQRLRRLAIELNLDVANLPMSALSRLDEKVRRQKEIQRMQLKRRIDISERLYREQKRMYLESLDLADAWKQKVKDKPKKATVETIIEEYIVEERQDFKLEVEGTCIEGGEPVNEQGNIDNSIPPPEPTEKFRREVKFEKPLLSQLIQLDDWLHGMWEDNVAMHRRYPVAKDDPFLDVKPNEIVFRNYSPGNIYTRRVYIDNQCYQCATIELQEILFQDDFFRSLFQVRPTESVRLLPGMCVDVTVEFCPHAKHMEPFSGALIYSVIRDGKTSLKRLRIGIRCEQTPEVTPANPDVQPRILCFPEAPHWNDKDFHVIFRKNVRFTNRGDESYYAHVQAFQERIEEPIPQPEELEEVEVVSTVVIRSKSSKRSAGKSLPIETIVAERSSPMLSQVITETCASLIKECADHPMEVFYWDHQYHINVPGRHFVDVTVHFAPPLPGEYKQTYDVTFHSTTGDILGKAQIEVSGKTIPLPLFLSPPDGLDFGVIIAADSMTYQDDFSLQNDSCAAITAVPIIPIHLKQFAEIIPRGKVIVNAFSTATFKLKLYPRRSMTTEARKVYDPITNIMNFLVRVRFCSSSRLGNIPSLTIPVTAKILLLDPSWLLLTPKMIDLGVVTTNNTVHTLLHLVNTTMIKLDFVILGVPKGAVIQPGYGRGSILPGETLDFDLLYSPRAGVDVPVAGDQVKVFRLQAESLIAMATDDSIKKKRHSIYDSMSYVMEDQTVIETVHPVSVAEDGSGSPAYDDVHNIIGELINAVDYESCASSSNATELTTQRSFKSTKRPNEVECRVLIQDPRCELSVTRLVLPPTPCGSSYIACFQLRTQNMASMICKCGGMNAAAKIRWCATAFTIESTCENFEVEPREGSLAAGQFITIFVKFSPVLARSDVYEMAKAIRMEKIQILMQEKPKKGAKGKKSGKKQESESEHTTDPNEVVIEPEDIKDAEKTLMETMESKLMESTIVCRVWTKPEKVDIEEIERYEELRCQVFSTMIRPDFLILSDTTIDFGPTVIGAHTTYKIQLQSLICKRIKVLMSPASPFSPFKVPAVCSYLVEPQHILELPAVFKPEETGEECEKFRLSSGKTAVTIRMLGFGVTPQLTLKPTFVICRLESFPGHSAECTFEVVNDCIAQLPLSLRQDYVRQGKELEPVSAISAPSSVNSKPEKKAKPEKKSKGKDKDSKHNYMSDFLTPDETLFLESTEESENPAALFDDSGLLIIEPSKKGTFKIHFRPPALPDSNLQKSKVTVGTLTESQAASHGKDKTVSDFDAESKTTAKEKGSKKNEKKKSGCKILPEELKIIYVAKYSLIVGNLRVVKEFLIIGKQKKGVPPKEKKSKTKSDVKKKK